MGQIDTTLRYNGIYNSYEMGPNDTIHASIFETQYLSHVTTQFVAVRVAGTIVDGWIEAIWIDADGEQIGTTKTVTWTPTRLWKRYTHTFEVPTGAVKVKLTYRSGTAGYHFSCPMTEAGEIASAYNAQTAAQLAYHTAGGSYVGFLNAEQITAGLLRAVNGGAWFDLDKPEIVMEGKQADLSITPENPLKLTDKSGNFIGGLGVAGGILGLVAGALTNDPDMNIYATVGYPAEGGSGISIYEKNHPDVYMGRFESGAFGIMMDGHARLVLGDDTYLIDENDVIRLWIDQNGDTFLIDENDVVRLWIDRNGNTFLQNAANAHAIGVDNTGPYRIKNGTKTYW